MSSTERWAAVALLALASTLFPLKRVSGASRAPGEQPHFDATNATLGDAAKQAASLLDRKIGLGLTPGHPARKARVSLTMAVSEPNDLLNALSAAFGLRWIESARPGEVFFVDKREYDGTAAGPRQAIADALPADLRDSVRPGNPNRPRSMEAGLKQLEQKEAHRLLAVSAKGPVALTDLDPELGRLLLQFLNAYLAFRLGNTCDLFVSESRKNGQALIHYGPNDLGTVQFSFKIGDRALAAKPE